MKIILHLGAHKTATTYIQNGLSVSADALNKHEVYIVPTIDFRNSIKKINKNSHPINRFALVRSWRASQLYQDYLRQAKKASCSRMVISEEGFLGSIHQLTNEGRFYQHEKLKRNLIPCVSHLKGHPITAMLAVRSYDSFFTSAWCQTVKEQGYRTFDEALKKQLMLLKRGWFDVISDILNILPESSQLRVWRLEDFKKDENSVFSELVGSGNVGHMTLPKKNMLPGLSKQAVTQLENLQLRGEPSPRPVVLEMVKKYSKFKGFDDFSPWDEVEKGVLVERYAADIARIRAQWPDIMIH